MVKRAAVIWVILAVLATVPVLALDFDSWRMDGSVERNSSINQSSSNAGFNLLESLFDPLASSFGLYWKGEHQENGGRSLRYGNLPLTEAILDNREQDPTPDWASWPVVQNMTPIPPRPIFTHGIPQAWSPVEIDLNPFGGYDHFLVDATFEPIQVPPLVSNREQRLSGYYPQTEAQIPANGTVLPDFDATTGEERKKRVPPLWSLRIRDLEPVRTALNTANQSIPVLTHPLIFARVPAVYQDGVVNMIPNIVSEQRRVIYMVVGTGETDFARVICLSLDNNNDLPGDPASGLPATTSTFPLTTFDPPHADFFNPNTGRGGDVMWSYRVFARDGTSPVPVAGISFANVGDTNDSRPLLFLTTRDGQIIALNAKAADIIDFRDGDSEIEPGENGNDNASKERWHWWGPDTRHVRPPVPPAAVPGYHYGMQPAVARVTLTGMVPGGTNQTSQDTITRALARHNVAEWMLFVADSQGQFFAFDAPGEPQPSSQNINRWDADLRWGDPGPIPATGPIPLPPARLDGQVPTPEPERFITPPVVYQGSTPLRRSNGDVVGPASGVTDVGFDDQVIFASERGRMYALSALGEFNVGGGAAVDGTPTRTTFTRWTWPTDDTAADPGPASTDEPRAWPRELPDLNAAFPVVAGNPGDSAALTRNLGPPIPFDADFFGRSALSLALGPDANPDLANPDFDPGDDLVFYPYLKVRGDARNSTVNTNNPVAPVRRQPKSDPNTRYLDEFVGSLKPWGFIQLRAPIQLLKRVSFIDPVAGQVDIPISHLRVGTVKGNARPVTQIYDLPAINTFVAVPSPIPPNPPTAPPNPYFNQLTTTNDDTVYLAAPEFYDEATDRWFRIPCNGTVQVTINYDRVLLPNDPNPADTTETLPYPSCYREVQLDPDDDNPTNGDFESYIVHGRASLSVDNNRLEQRAFRRRRNPLQPAPNRYVILEEDPAELPLAGFGDPRAPAPPAIGGDGTALYTLTGPLVTPAAAGARQPSMFAAGGGSGGVLLVPSFFRGRVFALDHRLRLQRTILAAADPYLNRSSAFTAQFGDVDHFGSGGGPPVVGARPRERFGPPADLTRSWTYDPGDFYDPDADITPPAVPEVFPADDPQGPFTLSPFVEDETAIQDVGASVTLVDGWLYITYRNGHIRAYSSNISNGSGSAYNPPFWDNPNPGGNNGNGAGGGTVVEAPATIRLLTQNTPGLNYRDGGTLDQSVMFDWGEQVYVEVDYGAVGGAAGQRQLTPSNASDPNDNILEIDARVLQQPVQIVIRNSSNRPVQQLPGLNQGLRPTIQQIGGVDHVVAVIPLFAGVPSPTDPLTPGTPLLWERDPTSPTNNFNGEWTYELQVSQPGVQWRWPDNMTTGESNGTAVPAKQHYWESEKNAQNQRFATSGGTTGGTPNWSWTGPLREYAPLVSYHNPIEMFYDPDGALPGVGLMDPISGTPITAPIGSALVYTDRNAPGRKNGDMYVTPSVDGGHSGSGAPVVPIVGAGHRGGSGQQFLFGSHGQTSPVSTTRYPDVGKLRVGDRSFLNEVGVNLRLRVQRAPLTKMGMGALFGRQASGDASLVNVGPPAGSFEQNAAILDDGPNQLYPSIPENRLVVTRLGTQQDLATGPVDVPGRGAKAPNGSSNPPPGIAALEQLGVQVDIPLYTADDVYSTRYRPSGPQGAPATGPDGPFNPFVPGATPWGQPSRPLWDHAEKRSRYPAAQDNLPPSLAPNEQPGNPPNGPNWDDRLRRVVLFNDANNNGQLDLTHNFREAYRTFGVQVAVRPDLKVSVQQATLDMGSPWTGKKGPGIPARGGTGEILEYQRMAAMTTGTPVERSLALFYQKYWKQFNLLNTGNVNLAFMKPELIYKPTNQVIGLAGEGNDPWRALGFIHAVSAAALADPLQILLRTSVDDQLLPDASLPYAGGVRGIWLQKATIGAAQPGSVAYVDPNPNGAPARRDPSTGGLPRELFMALNIPTGAALGQYGGSIRWYNDRSVTLAETPNQAPGYRYIRPEAAAGLPGNTAANGDLDRYPLNHPTNAGEPIEPATDPALRVKVKVIENMLHGRGPDAATAQNTPDGDRRSLPGVLLDQTTASGAPVTMGLTLAYTSNRRNPGALPSVSDVFGAQLRWDPNRFLFPFDELPLDRPPWMGIGANPGNPGWGDIDLKNAARVVGRPSAVQDAFGVGALAWTERMATTSGRDEYRIWYANYASGAPPTISAPILLSPLGQPPDTSIQRSSVRMLPSIDVQGTAVQRHWLAVFAKGPAQRKDLSYTFFREGANPAVWSPEHLLSTSRAFATVDDPYAVVTGQVTRQPAPLPQPPGPIANEAAIIPKTAVIAYAANNPRIGRNDVFMSRWRVDSLTSVNQFRPVTPGAPDPQGNQDDFAKIAFPRMDRDLLQANPARTIYTSGGIDWLIRPNSPVQVWMARPDVPPGQLGSLSNPLQLLNDPEIGVFATNDELVLQFGDGTASPRNIRQVIPQDRVIIDRSAGTVRFTHDTRTLARAIWAGLTLTGPPMTTTSPDPILMADYTPATLRITRGEVGATDPVLIPVLSQPGLTVYDASWYQQQLAGPAAASTAVRGIADRMWIFWRRAAGPNSGGQTCYYKVLRPGVRVSAGIASIAPADLTVTAGTGTVVPEEVNPQTGQIFFPQTFESQRVAVQYRTATGATVTEARFVNWIDETGERPVPMETSVNEGSLDAFASFETVPMFDRAGGATDPNTLHMERVWMVWGSTRQTLGPVGGDLFFAALAPRIGPAVNVNGSLAVQSFNTAASLLAGRGAAAARQQAQQALDLERRRPFTIPPTTRRGPFIPGQLRGASFSAGRR